MSEYSNAVYRVQPPHLFDGIVPPGYGPSVTYQLTKHPTTTDPETVTRTVLWVFTSCVTCKKVFRVWQYIDDNHLESYYNLEKLYAIPLLNAIRAAHGGVSGVCPTLRKRVTNVERGV